MPISQWLSMLLGWGAFVFPVSNLINFYVVKTRIRKSIPTTVDINDGTFNGKPDNPSADTHLGQHVPWLGEFSSLLSLFVTHNPPFKSCSNSPTSRVFPESVDSTQLHPKITQAWSRHFVLKDKNEEIVVRRGLAVAEAQRAATSGVTTTSRGHTHSASPVVVGSFGH